MWVIFINFGLFAMKKHFFIFEGYKWVFYSLLSHIFLLSKKDNYRKIIYLS